MGDVSLEDLMEHYAVSLQAWQDKATIDKRTVLTVLHARDGLVVALKNAVDVSAASITVMIDYDQLLRERAVLVNQVLSGDQFVKWRETIQPNKEAWWWWLENFTPIHPMNRLDGVWKLITIAGWTANVSLLVNIASKFLGGGVGLLGVATVALPSILALLQLGTEFTKMGRDSFEKILTSLKIPGEWREEAKLGITLLLFASLCGLWLNLPSISKGYSWEGALKFREGKLREAEQNFLTAISLDGTNAEAHYNLGSIYDRLEQTESASKEYLLAVAAGLPDAYNNLGRLYIKDKKYDQAALFLNQGIKNIESKQSVDPKLKYALHKNLGWVRFYQERYEDAEIELKKAIEIAEVTASINPKPAFAYCVAAQVREKLKQPALALWQKCNELGSVFNPDEDPLLYEARQKLKK